MLISLQQIHILMELALALMSQLLNRLRIAVNI